LRFTVQIKLKRVVRLQVEQREGVLQPVFDQSLDAAGGTLDWMTYIRPARDRHEQNVEVVLGCDGEGLRLRTSRAVKPGDELLVWYGDLLALDLGVPVLTPANIRGTVLLFLYLRNIGTCSYTQQLYTHVKLFTF